VVDEEDADEAVPRVDGLMALGLRGASEGNEKGTKMGVLKNSVCSPKCNSDPEER
jgi:hypothetical protein